MKAVRIMTIYPLDEFHAEVSALPLKTDEDTIGFIPRAARLAALPGGDSKPFLRWPELAEKLRTPLPLLLRRRALEGMWDIDQALGENLAIAIVDSQDFTAFAALARELTPDAVGSLLTHDALSSVEAWKEEAEDAILDSEAVSFLVDWAEMFPIREDLRLRIVDAPFSAFEESLISRFTRPEALPLETYDIAELFESADQASRLKAADGSSPSRTLMQLMELDKEIDSGDHGLLIVTRRLDQEWLLRVTVEQVANGGETIFPLNAVRYGHWPAKRRENGEWAVDLRFIPSESRMPILRAPIWLVPEQGKRICLR